MAEASVASWFVKAAFTIIFTIPNALGVELVGRGLLTFSVLILVPFLVFSIWAMAEASDWTSLQQVMTTDTNETNYASTGDVAIDWDSLLGFLFWNVCNGFASVSLFAGEVATPDRMYPKALVMATIAIIFMYMIPLAGAAVYNDPMWASWEAGSFSDVAASLGGDSFKMVISIVYVLSTWGLYSANLFGCTYQLSGMGESGLAPAIFARRHEKTHVPIWSLAFALGIALILVGLDLSSILTMTNVLSAVSQVMLILAAIRLRVTQPELHRPFTAPGSVAMIALMSVPPVVLCVFLVYFALRTTETAIASIVVVACGVLYAFAMKITSKDFIDPKTQQTTTKSPMENSESSTVFV
jgi:amino acid transporter